MISRNFIKNFIPKLVACRNPVYISCVHLQAGKAVYFNKMNQSTTSTNQFNLPKSSEKKNEEKEKGSSGQNDSSNVPDSGSSVNPSMETKVESEVPNEAKVESEAPLTSASAENMESGMEAPSSQLTSSDSDDDHLGEEDWKPISEELLMVNNLMREGMSPREILAEIAPGLDPPEDVGNEFLWRIIIQLMSEPQPRSKLPQYNTLDDAVQLIRQSRKIVVLTGAGISVSCGIPDFRSKEGIYSRLHVDFPDLPHPTAMFDINYFRRNQRPFFQFAKEIYPGQFEPSISHRFIGMIEKEGKLLRNYTQNIDTLEQVAGIKNVVQCHGSFATATCCVCKYKCDAEEIRPAIFNQEIPRCPKCPQGTEMAVIKPDIVFFGEDLPEQFHQQMTVDKDEVDLLIVIGSSLKVRPVALIPSSIPPEVPQILIDRQSLSHMTFDIELLGYCDGIVEELLRRLGDPWNGILPASATDPLKVVTDLGPLPPEILNPPPRSTFSYFTKDTIIKDLEESKTLESPVSKRPRMENDSGADSTRTVSAPPSSSTDDDSKVVKRSVEISRAQDDSVLKSPTQTIPLSSNQQNSPDQQQVADVKKKGDDKTEDFGHAPPDDEIEDKEEDEYEFQERERSASPFNLASLLPDHSLYHDKTYKTVFKGAVLYYQEDDQSSSSSSSSSSSTGNTDTLPAASGDDREGLAAAATDTSLPGGDKILSFGKTLDLLSSAKNDTANNEKQPDASRSSALIPTTSNDDSNNLP